MCDSLRLAAPGSGLSRDLLLESLMFIPLPTLRWIIPRMRREPAISAIDPNRGETLLWEWQSKPTWVGGNSGKTVCQHMDHPNLPDGVASEARRRLAFSTRMYQ